MHGYSYQTKKDNDQIDRVIDEAHLWAHLSVFTSLEHDKKKKAEIAERMGEIESKNGLVREALLHHPDPVSFLANRQIRNAIRERVLVQHRNLQDKSPSEMSYCFREVPV